MAIGRGVVPEVSKIEPLWIEILTVSAIVLQISPAMAARRHRDTDAVEYARPALREVNQGIMRRIKLLPPRKGALHRESDPVTKLHWAVQMCGEMIGPSWKGVDEEGSARNKGPATFVNPLEGPAQIVLVLPVVFEAVPVFLVEIERGVRKDRIDGFGPNGGKEVQAVCLKHHPVRGRQPWGTQPRRRVVNARGRLTSWAHVIFRLVASTLSGPGSLSLRGRRRWYHAFLPQGSWR